MSNQLPIRLKQLSHPQCLPYLTQIQRGIEKEGLRVTPQGSIAQTKHPKALGSALMHPSITTDYSEALLEFITPVFQRIDDSLDYLSDLHSFTMRHLKDEYLWPASMPCKLAGEHSIPIAQYGSSNIGQIKHVYRQGLSLRYGRAMQSIAGIHYNFSMADDFWPHYQQLLNDQGDLQSFKSQQYFSLIRNFRRHSWLLIYLFGASPELDDSFIGSKQTEPLIKIKQDTLGLPFATSLRMSDLGYKSQAQCDLNISYHNLDSYVEDLSQAIATPYPAYQKFEDSVNGSYHQLNANVLQLENEYYSDIRPKRVPHTGEKSLEALSERGVEYIEVRILDINPLLAVGIDAQQIKFLDAFLLYCLLSDSPALSTEEQQEIEHNQQRVILEGRRPSLMLTKNTQQVALIDAASELLVEISDITNLLDQAHGNSTLLNTNSSYSDALASQVAKVKNSELTPSGIISKANSNGTNGNGFIASMNDLARKHHSHFISRGLSDAMNTKLQQATSQSLLQQQELEASDDLSLSDFIKQYK